MKRKKLVSAVTVCLLMVTMFPLTVSAAAPSKVTLSPTSVTLGVKESRALKATYSPSNATSKNTYTSSNKAVATVSSAGKITAVKAGSATVTVRTSNGRSATCKVTVKAAPKTVTMNVKTATLGVGQTQTLSASYNSGAAGTKKWTSSNTSVASVDSAGKVKALKVGTATIKATAYNGKYASCKVTVKAAPKTVTMNVKTATLGVGQTKTLSASYNSGAVGTKKWTSSNTSVASVDSAGKVKALKVGTATIKATAYNGKYASCTVTVKAAPTKVTMSKTSAILGKGDSLALSASFAPSNALTTKTWTSSNKSVATVDSSGKVKAVNVGKATIKVTAYNGSYASCSIEVKAAPTAIAFTNKTITLGAGETVSLATKFTPSTAAASLKYQSANTAIATVTASGVVKGVKAGSSTTIKVITYNGKPATCTVYVKAAPAGIKLGSISRTTFGAGESVKLSASLTTTTAASVIKWSSDNTAVATVDKSGLVKTLRAGTVTITASTYNSRKASVKLTVRSAPTGIKLTASTLKLATKQTATLGYTLNAPLFSTTAGAVKWTSSNTSLATVNSSTGLVTAIKDGTVTITATAYNGRAASCTLTILPAPTKVALSKTSLPLYLGQSATLTATLTPSNAYTTVSYSTSNANIATVDGNGKVTAKAVGPVTITAKTTNGFTSTCKVTVYPAPVSVSLNTVEVNLLKAESFQLKATVAPSNAQQNVTWSSAKTAVATVSSTGLIKAIALGTTTVTAKAVNGKTITITVNVRPPATDIKISDVTYGLGTTKVCPTTVMVPSNAIVRNTYSSSNTDVAIANADGTITAVGVGTSEITVTAHNGSKATCTMTVVIPVGTNVADIVAYYNYCANSTKASTGRFDLEIAMTSELEMKVGGISAPLGEDGSKRAEYYGMYENGQPMETLDDDGVALQEALPVHGKPYMSILKPEHVASASCTKSGENYLVTITAKSQKLSPNQTSEWISSTMMEMNDVDMPDSGEMEDMKTTYSGKIEAEINSDNLLKKSRNNFSMQMEGSYSLIPVYMRMFMQDDIVFYWIRK